jgi:uncharacterized protein YqkB
MAVNGVKLNCHSMLMTESTGCSVALRRHFLAQDAIIKHASLESNFMPILKQRIGK